MSTHEQAIKAAAYYNSHTCDDCDKFFLDEDGMWGKGLISSSGEILEQVSLSFHAHSVISYAKRLGWSGGSAPAIEFICDECGDPIDGSTNVCSICSDLLGWSGK
jgi:hypothetical protein